MKVKELVELLAKLDQEKEITFEDDVYGIADIKTVEEHKDKQFYVIRP